MNLFLFFLPLLSLNYCEKYEHPKPEDLLKKLTNNLREEVVDNFYILQTVKYDHDTIREHLLNESIYIKYTMLENKMKNSRKMDLLFARHSNMVRSLHINAEKNLLKLEQIRKLASDTLADLKENHIDMLHKLHNNQIEVESIIENKKEIHLDKMTDYYKNWKDRREEILDTIDFDSDL